MTGTVCELDETSSTQKSNPIKLLTSWLFGPIHAESLLIEITLDGASILIPTKSVLSSETYNLFLMSPENQKKIHGVVNADIRWVDTEYSRTLKKAGLQFNHTGDETIRCIDEIIHSMEAEPTVDIKCSLMGC